MQREDDPHLFLVSLVKRLRFDAVSRSDLLARIARHGLVSELPRETKAAPPGHAIFLLLREFSFDVDGLSKLEIRALVIAGGRSTCAFQPQAAYTHILLINMKTFWLVLYLLATFLHVSSVLTTY
jgi:hypothetical protein